MDRDFIVGIVLLFVLFFVWQHFTPKPEPPMLGEERASTAEGERTTPSLVSDFPGAPPATELGAPGSLAATLESDQESAIPAIPLVKPAPPILVEGETFIARFTNVGARLESWKLKHFNDVAGPKGVPLEVVSLAELDRLPMSTYWVGSGPRMTERDTYRIVDRGPEKIVFAREDGRGFRITKTFEPNMSGYDMKVTIQITSLSGATGEGRLSLSTYQKLVVTKSSFFMPNLDVVSHVAYVSGDLERTPIEKSGSLSYPGNIIWAGFENLYFLSAIAPKVSESAQVQMLPAKKPGEPYASIITMPQALIGPESPLVFEFTAYLGPKTEGALSSAGHNFDQALDFGMFTVISKVLVRVLHFFFAWTHNWGVAIIIVTVIIKVLLLPLTQKSFKSMKAMSALQPAMQELREKHKDDREKLNQEMMALYKAHGVNPASGCVPMLAQLPIFLAFYRALYGTIELRHAPFTMWIMDLSAPDPYYVMPIVMGASMVATQKLTPTSADPMQAKMMMLMPVVFTFFFLNLPAGLVLYWLVSNILSIFQQMYLKRSVDDPKPVLVAKNKGDEKTVEAKKPAENRPPGRRKSRKKGK